MPEASPAKKLRRTEQADITEAAKDNVSWRLRVYFDFEHVFFFFCADFLVVRSWLCFFVRFI